MSKLNLGKVALTPKGEWSASTAYERLDVVSHEGSSYTVLKECQGITPVEGEYYSLLAAKGGNGAQGEPGPGFSSGGTTGQILTKQSGTDYDTVWKTLAPYDIGAATNRNFIRNWDFRKPVNRNGHAEYTAQGYAIDRWAIDNNATIQLTENGSLVLSGRMDQRLEPERLYAGQYTFSVLIDSIIQGTGMELFLQERGGDFFSPIVLSPTASGLYTGTAFVPYTENGYMAILIASSGSVAIKAVKLELGSQQTLARQNEDGEWEIIDPPDYDLQYALCSQYSPSTGEWVGSQHSNRNLFDNGYFIGGGSQQVGGQFPINQRGQTTYANPGTTAKYGVDRWMYSNSTLTVEKEGIKFVTGSGTRAYFLQKCPNPERFLGKIFTVSIFSSQSEFYTTNISIPTPSPLPTSFTRIVNTNFGIYHLEVWYEPSEPLMYFQFNVDSVGETIFLKAIKLELGPVQTLAHKEGDTWVLNDPHPDYALELVKCQRYYELGYATAQKAPYYNMQFVEGASFKVVKRAVPNVKIYSTDNSGTRQENKITNLNGDFEEATVIQPFTNIYKISALKMSGTISAEKTYSYGYEASSDL